jgi:hypothetical protein
MRGPNFIDFGKRPDFTPASHVLLETGINAGIGGSLFGSPMILDNRRKPVSGKVILEVMGSMSRISLFVVKWRFRRPVAAEGATDGVRSGYPLKRNEPGLPFNGSKAFERQGRFGRQLRTPFYSVERNFSPLLIPFRGEDMISRNFAENRGVLFLDIFIKYNDNSNIYKFSDYWNKQDKL